MGCIAIFIACGVFALYVGAIGGGTYWVLTEVFAVSDADAGEASGCAVLIAIWLPIIIGFIITES